VGIEWIAITGFLAGATALVDRFYSWRSVSKSLDSLDQRLRSCEDDRQKLWERINGEST
jgi:hypothetical protein